MLPLVLLLNLFFSSGIGEKYLTETEWSIFLNLTRMTYAKNCVIAPRHLHEGTAGRILKILSEERIYALVIEPDHLLMYLENMDMKVYRWTVIVLKEEELNSVDYFNNKDIIHSYFWIIFDASNGTLKQELQKIYIPFDSATVLIEKITEDHYIISEFYNIKKFAPGILRTFGEWNNNNLVTYGGEWFDRKSNLQKYEFKTTKFNEGMYLTPKDKVNEEIWYELSQLLNFTVVDKVIEYSPENVTRVLQSEEEEALLDTQIYIGRGEEYTYLLGPTSRSGLYMHIKAEGEDTRPTRFLKPFSMKIWTNITLWVIFGGILMFLLEYLTRKFGGNLKPLLESYLMIFTPLDCICSQCGSEIGDTITTRFLLLLMRYSGLFFSYAYSATLISYLLLFIPHLPFTNLRGFVEDGTYKMVAERNSDVDIFFRVSKNPLENLVYEKFLLDTRKWMRLDKEMDKLCAGEKLVLIAFDNEVVKYAPCRIVRAKRPLKMFENGFKIRFKSPFRGLLHIKLLLLRTTGVLQRVNNRIINDHFIKKRETTEYYNINMEKVTPVFVLLLGGLGMSVIILSIEIVIRKLKKTPKRRKRRIFYHHKYFNGVVDSKVSPFD